MFTLFKGAATKNKSWPYKYEMIAMLTLAITFFLSASLLSHHHADCSWFYYDTLHKPTANWCGFVGACVAALLFYLFGGASLIILGFALFTFYCLIHKKKIAQEWDRTASYIVLLLTVSTLLTIYEIDILESPWAGGYCGRIVSSVLHQWFDEIGTFILLYTLLVASLIVILRFSFVAIIYYLFKNVSFDVLWTYFINPCKSVVHCMCYPVKKIGAHSKRFYKNQRGSTPEDGSEAWQANMHSLYGDTFWKDLKKPIPVKAASTSVKDDSVTDFDSDEKQPQELHQQLQTAESIIIPAYQLPHIDMFIGVDEEHNDHALVQELEKRATILQEKLEHFDVYGKVTAIKRGPVVTMFEYQPQIDTKISKIIALEDDLSLALQAHSIRIIAPIPGKSLVGFEVANKNRRGVMLNNLIKTDVYLSSNAQLPMILGVDTIGGTVVMDLTKMPHLLMAGSTGSGKSVALNAMLISLLCKISPDDLRLVIIDPKRLEFAPYADIAHLLFPIITDPKMAPPALRWLVKQMEQRYEIMAQAGARNIYDYRQQAHKENRDSMPFIVIIIDELADLMMTSGKEVEDAIIRITQMARAAGIHLIAATQRPSVDVITGLIKVNFPSRISFRVTSKIDSRTILDCAGADKLLGRGDMLFLDANDSVLKRVHGAYVLDKEINQVIAHIRAQRPPDYLDLKQVCTQDRTNADMQTDQMYDEICQYLQEIDEVSISLLQRRFRIGYNRSARIIDMLESQGLIAPSYGGKTRKVIR